MAPTEAPATRPVAPLIAPRWHTVALVALFVSVSALGLLTEQQTGPRPPPENRITAVYVPLLITEWGLFLYVWLAGLRRRGTRVRDLVGGSWSKARAVVIDVALALAGIGLLAAMERAWPSDAARASAMLPGTAAEKTVWIVVSLSVAWCEELIFRGYLQRQFEALFGSSAVAIVLQGALFGLIHAEQGWIAAAKIALYGVGLGVLARARRSLRPGMLLHALSDLAAGLLRA